MNNYSSSINYFRTRRYNDDNEENNNTNPTKKEDTLLERMRADPFFNLSNSKLNVNNIDNNKKRRYDSNNTNNTFMKFIDETQKIKNTIVETKILPKSIENFNHWKEISLFKWSNNSCALDTALPIIINIFYPLFRNSNSNNKQVNKINECLNTCFSLFEQEDFDKCKSFLWEWLKKDQHFMIGNNCSITRLFEEIISNLDEDLKSKYRLELIESRGCIKHKSANDKQKSKKMIYNIKEDDIRAIIYHIFSESIDMNEISEEVQQEEEDNNDEENDNESPKKEYSSNEDEEKINMESYNDKIRMKYIEKLRNLYNSIMNSEFDELFSEFIFKLQNMSIPIENIIEFLLSNEYLKNKIVTKCGKSLTIESIDNDNEMVVETNKPSSCQRKCFQERSLINFGETRSDSPNILLINLLDLPKRFSIIIDEKLPENDMFKKIFGLSISSSVITIKHPNNIINSKYKLIGIIYLDNEHFWGEYLFDENCPIINIINTNEISKFSKTEAKKQLNITTPGWYWYDGMKYDGKAQFIDSSKPLLELTNEVKQTICLTRKREKFFKMKEYDNEERIQDLYERCPVSFEFVHLLIYKKI